MFTISIYATGEKPEVPTAQPDSVKQATLQAGRGCYHFPHVRPARRGRQRDEYAALAAAERATYAATAPHHATAARAALKAAPPTKFLSGGRPRRCVECVQGSCQGVVGELRAVELEWRVGRPSRAGCLALVSRQGVPSVGVSCLLVVRQAVRRLEGS